LSQNIYKKNSFQLFSVPLIGSVITLVQLKGGYE